MVGDNFGCLNWGRDSTSICWVEVRDAATHTAMPEQSPPAKGSPDSTPDSAEVENHEFQELYRARI